MLNAMLREMSIESGKVEIDGSVAYAAQQAWYVV